MAISLLALGFTGCDTIQPALESPDAKVTLSQPYVATEKGAIPQSKAEPGTYAENQVIESGTYTRTDLERFFPGSLPETAQIEPGKTPSMFEQIASSIGGIAAAIPGGQPIAAGALALAGLGKIWRDKRKIDDTEAVARTLAKSRDSALDVVATLPDKEQARNLEREINEHTEHFARSLGKARKYLDAILKETETPTKKKVSSS